MGHKLERAQTSQLQTEIIKRVAQSPPITVTGNALFMLSLAMSIPAMFTENADTEEWTPFLREEGERLICAIRAALPAEAQCLIPTE